jgi:transposase
LKFEWIKGCFVTAGKNRALPLQQPHISDLLTTRLLKKPGIRQMAGQNRAANDFLKKFCPQPNLANTFA